MAHARVYLARALADPAHLCPRRQPPVECRLMNTQVGQAGGTTGEVTRVTLTHSE